MPIGSAVEEHRIPVRQADRSRTSPITTVWSPPLYSARRVQSTHATEPSSTGAPDGAGDQRSPTYFPVPEWANRSLSAFWSSARTLTQNRPISRMCGQVTEVRAGHSATSRGLRDKDVKDWQVNPSGSSPMAVTTVTPEAKDPRTVRMSRARMEC